MFVFVSDGSATFAARHRSGASRDRPKGAAHATTAAMDRGSRGARISGERSRRRAPKETEPTPGRRTTLWSNPPHGCSIGNGGRHCCQPPLRRAKDMPVFVTWSSDLSACRPALDPGSPAQASLPIEQLPLARSPTSLPKRRPGGSTSLSTRPAWRWKPKLPAKTVLCSAALLGSTSPASRFVLRTEMLRTASRWRRSTLPAPHTD